MSKVLNKVLFLLIILDFIFIPLYPKTPFLNINETFVAIRLEDFLIAITYAVWGITTVSEKKIKDLFNDRLNQAMLLFFFIGLVSLFSGIFLTQTVVSSKLGFLHFIRRVEYMMFLPITFYVVRTKKQLFTILWILMLVVLGVNIYALGQQYLDWPVISTTNSEFSKGLILRLTPGARVNSTFAGHYDLAIFLTSVLVILTSVYFGVNKRNRIWIIILALLSMGILILTAARISFVAAVLGMFMVIIMLKKKKLIALFIVILLMILIYPSQLRDRLVSTITVNILNLGQRYSAQTNDQRLRSTINIPTLAIKTSSTSAQTSTFATPSGKTATDITPGEPIDTTQLGVYRSFEIRLNLEWPRAILGFLKNPLLGTGYSSLAITVVKDRIDSIAIDNDFLRSLGEVGILGTIAFVLIIIDVLKRLRNGFRNQDKFIRHLCVGVFVMILAFLINAVFIDVFEASKVAELFWMVLGLSLASLKFNT